MSDEEKRCTCSCHSCCVPLDAWCEDCEEDHPDAQRSAEGAHINEGDRQ